MHSGLPLLLGAANIIDEGRIEIGATKCELLLNRLELLGKNSRIAEFLTPEQKAKVRNWKPHVAISKIDKKMHYEKAGESA